MPLNHSHTKEQKLNLIMISPRSEDFRNAEPSIGHELPFESALNVAVSLANLCQLLLAPPE